MGFAVFVNCACAVSIWQADSRIDLREINC